MTIENCTFEWDELRGVLYVHSPQGYTILRVCQLPKYPVALKAIAPGDMLDITFGHGISMPGGTAA